MRFLPLFFKKVIQCGVVEIHEPNGNVTSIGGIQPGPKVTIRLTDTAIERKVLLSPEMAIAEAHMDGSLIVENGEIYDLLALILLNADGVKFSRSRLLLRGADRQIERLRQNHSILKSRQNVARHYDLGNSFYRKWLDGDMQYSCGYFANPDVSLDDAQTAKKRHIAAKMSIKPGQRILDIGCGWGGMAIYLGMLEDVEVLGVTLSTEQLSAARARAEALNISHRIKFELMDYRHLTGKFDNIVSVGMLEHVGLPQLQTYFNKVYELLADDGVALIHSISNRSYHSSTGPFLRKYIFPGAYAPTISEIAKPVEKSGLWMTDLEIQRVHYAETLRRWRSNFVAVRAEIALEYDETFVRMWEFYLAATEAAFRHGKAHVAQAQLAHDRAAVPLTRSYIETQEDIFEAREAGFIGRITDATNTVFST
ncbi:MAG: cyclopropane-fatty-acyl-phospholipid synthase family protein [Paracoccaceae bacterium]|jgi:cyclopropane-fatty-acyl-phospholipid synthase